MELVTLVLLVGLEVVDSQDHKVQLDSLDRQEPLELLEQLA